LLACEGDMVRISLTPIIDVVFILLIFFMLATNFQSFNQTDIKLSNEEASISQSEKRVYLVEFNKDGEFRLNKETMSQKNIKKQILDSKKKQEEYLVVIKGDKNTEIQDILNVIADFKKNNINEITIGISKNDIEEDYDSEKESMNMPLLEKM
jgi:biopolymer transport protein ExbD